MLRYSSVTLDVLNAKNLSELIEYSYKPLINYHTLSGLTSLFAYNLEKVEKLQKRGLIEPFLLKLEQKPIQAEIFIANCVVPVEIQPPSEVIASFTHVMNGNFPQKLKFFQNSLPDWTLGKKSVHLCGVIQNTNIEILIPMDLETICKDGTGMCINIKRFDSSDLKKIFEIMMGQIGHLFQVSERQTFETAELRQKSNTTISLTIGDSLISCMTNRLYLGEVEKTIVIRGKNMWNLIGPPLIQNLGINMENEFLVPEIFGRVDGVTSFSFMDYEDGNGYQYISSSISSLFLAFPFRFESKTDKESKMVTNQIQISGTMVKTTLPLYETLLEIEVNGSQNETEYQCLLQGDQGMSDLFFPLHHNNSPGNPAIVRFDQLRFIWNHQNHTLKLFSRETPHFAFITMGFMQILEATAWKTTSPLFIWESSLGSLKNSSFRFE